MLAFRAKKLAFVLEHFYRGCSDHGPGDGQEPADVVCAGQGRPGKLWADGHVLQPGVHMLLVHHSKPVRVRLQQRNHRGRYRPVAHWQHPARGSRAEPERWIYI